MPVRAQEASAAKIAASSNGVELSYSVLCSKTTVWTPFRPDEEVTMATVPNVSKTSLTTRHLQNGTSVRAFTTECSCGVIIISMDIRR